MSELPVTARELWPGVYALTFPEPGDAILVDSTRAHPTWSELADIEIRPRPGDCLTWLIEDAALSYRRSLGPPVTEPPVRPRGSA